MPSSIIRILGGGFAAHERLPMFLRCLALLALVGLPITSLAQTTPTPVRVGVLGYTDATSTPLYAQSAGFFKKYGLEANIISAVAAMQRGIPIVALAPAAVFDEKDRADTLLVKARGSKLRTGADL